MKCHPYLNFEGKTEEAFEFYAKSLGRKIAEIHRFGELPMEGVTYSKEDAKKVMHVRIDLDDGHAIMGSDTLPALGHKLTVGNNYYVSLNPKTKEEGARAFAALSKGGKVEFPYGEAPWGAYWGAFRDKYGVQWMVNWDMPK